MTVFPTRRRLLTRAIVAACVLCAGLTITGFSCGPDALTRRVIHANELVRDQAASDLRCPENEVRLVLEEGDTRADACGQVAVYSCSNVDCTDCPPVACQRVR